MWRQLRILLEMIKFEHTLFALPFAYVGAFLAVDGVPRAHDLAWITVAMVGARSLAMALNRLIDAGIDARNPRTAGRELPAGLLSRTQVLVFCAAALALYLVAVFQLDPIVRWLWPIPLLGFVVYPYLKRWTWLCHLWLGVVDGLAPVGGWVAVTGRLPWEAWALGGAVAFWVAGFDLFYSLFDLEVDRAPTIAAVSQTRSCADGIPSTASSAPMYANGSAKTVCSILTSDAKRRGRAGSAVSLTWPDARSARPRSARARARVRAGGCGSRRGSRRANRAG